LEKNNTKAVEWWEKAAQQGHAIAQYNVGRCYRNGWGVAKIDEKKGAEWIEKAAAQGHVGARGRCYLEGWGVEKDEAKAVELYAKAASQGDFAAAQCNLGVCYHYGQGVEKDEEKAMEWYVKAAAQGLDHAQCNLGAFYEKD